MSKHFIFHIQTWVLKWSLFHPSYCSACLCFPHCDGCSPVVASSHLAEFPYVEASEGREQPWGQRQEQGREEIWVGVGFLYINSTSNSAVWGIWRDKADRGGAQRSVRNERQLMLLQRVVMRAHFISSELWRAWVEIKWGRLLSCPMMKKKVEP